MAGSYRDQDDSGWRRTIFLDKSEEVINSMGVVVSIVVGLVEVKRGRRVSLIQLDVRLVSGLGLSQQSIFIFLMFPGFTSQREVTRGPPIPGALSSSHLLGVTVTLYEIPQGSSQRPLQCRHLSAGLPSVSMVHMSVV